MCLGESRRVCVCACVCCQQTVLTVARFHHVMSVIRPLQYQYITQFVSKLYRMCHIRSTMFQFKIDQRHSMIIS